MNTYRITIRECQHSDGTVSASFLTFRAWTSIEALQKAVNWCQRHQFHTAAFKVEVWHD